MNLWFRFFLRLKKNTCCQTAIFKFHFPTNSAIVFKWVDARIPEDMKRQMDEVVDDKIKFDTEIGFLNIAK